MVDRKKWIILGGVLALVLILGSAFLTYFFTQSKNKEQSCLTEDCQEDNKNNDTGEVDVSNMEDNTVSLVLEEEVKTGSYNQKDYILKLFRLDSKSDVVKEVNTSLKEEYNKMKEDDTEGAVYETTCFLTQKDTLVSFMVRHMGMIPETSFISNKYFVYLFDLKENKMLSKEDLYTLFETNEETILTKLKASLSKDENIQTIQIDQAYINEKNQLSVIYKRVLDGNVFYYVYDVD